MSKELAANFKFKVIAQRKTEHGGFVLSIQLVDPQEYPKGLALAMYEETIFEGDFFIFANEVFGSKKAD